MHLAIHHTSEPAKFADDLIAAASGREPATAFDRLLAVARAQEEARAAEAAE